MTKANENHARGRTRLMLARLLSDYARKVHCEGVINPRLEEGEESPAFSSHLRFFGENAAPEADLIWLKDATPEWKFHLLPGRKIAIRIAAGLVPIADMLVCLDITGNTGFIEPRRLLRFLQLESEGARIQEAAELLEKLRLSTAPQPDAQFNASVLDNSEFIPDHFSLKMRAGYAQAPAPGQFLQVMCDPAPHAGSPRYRALDYSEKRLPPLRGIELLGRRPFLRRPFSIASYGPSPGLTAGGAGKYRWLQLVTWLDPQFEIIYKRISDGPGTSSLARYQPGDTINVVGPLGKGYALGTPPKVAFLVGGGIGAPPLLFLAEELIRRGTEVRVFLGAVTKSKIPFSMGGDESRIERFERLGLHPSISTDDGSAGRAGLVTEPLVEHLEQQRPEPQSTRLFACGPRPLLAALEGISERFKITCEALLEERMACGFGACISCVCPMKEPGQKVKFTRICTEGPAFDVKKVMWYA